MVVSLLTYKSYIYNAIKMFNKNMFEHCTGLAYSVFPFELQDHNTTNMRNMIILIIRCMPISKSINLTLHLKETVA